MLGIMRRSPCDAVNVVVREPVVREPWTAPAAPPSDSISTIDGTEPQMFVLHAEASSSQVSAMGDEGVMGYIAATSEHANAIWAAAVLPSTMIFFAMFAFSFDFAPNAKFRILSHKIAI